MPTIVFFDYDKKKIESYEKVLGKLNKNIIFLHATFEEVLTKYYEKHPFVLVSPANSYGNMCGGFDKDIIKKFPTCKNRVLDLVKRSAYSDSSGRSYIPVGVCKFVELDNKNNVLLMAPTMLTPRNIVGTSNIYLAFSAIYKNIKDLDDSVIVACPCLGTGIGGMSGEESAGQILRFYKQIK